MEKYRFNNMEEIMTSITFTKFWLQTDRTGLKEKMAKRWFYLNDELRITIYNKALNDIPKKSAETYLNIGR